MPRLLALGAAALAYVGPVVANTWYLSETYDSSNFFKKFDFYESDYTTGDYNDVDPTSGYVNYLGYDAAVASGLVSLAGSDVYLGVDSKSKLVQGTGEKGRDGVRIESKNVYTHGLFVARFSHLPKPTCGSWPAFWTYSTNWPREGEVDMLEQWNLGQSNLPALHTGVADEVGSCLVSGAGGLLSSIITPNCDNSALLQETNKGCTFRDSTGPAGRDDGGVYAMEWNSDAIRLYAWPWSDVPGNLGSDTIDTSSWGTPSIVIPNNECNIDSHFANHKLVLNLNFCGALAGNDLNWLECAAVTGAVNCYDWVAQNPDAFADVFFQVQDIRVFNAERPAVPQPSPSPSPSSSSSSSSALSSPSPSPSGKSTNVALPESASTDSITLKTTINESKLASATSQTLTYTITSPCASATSDRSSRIGHVTTAYNHTPSPEVIVLPPGGGHPQNGTIIHHGNTLMTATPTGPEPTASTGNNEQYHAPLIGGDHDPSPPASSDLFPELPTAAKPPVVPTTNPISDAAKERLGLRAGAALFVSIAFAVCIAVI